ncbi:MAG: hypothetical protein U0R19_11420 [Bryobacteraceae bacterium]
MRNAEDLAHDTLLAILRRKDYEFTEELDFPKVCHGFAKYILQEARRKAGQEMRSIESMAFSLLRSRTQGLEDAELKVYLSELLRIGKENLDESDWDTITQGSDETHTQPRDGNHRVRVHRARTKLADLVQYWKRRR